jgi:hypothetical protein
MNKAEEKESQLGAETREQEQKEPTLKFVFLNSSSLTFLTSMNCGRSRRVRDEGWEQGRGEQGRERKRPTLMFSPSPSRLTRERPSSCEIVRGWESERLWK